MYVTVFAAALLAGQVGLDRYGVPATDAAAADSASSSEPTAPAAGGESAIPPETPEPTLESAAAGDISSSGAPTGKTPDLAPQPSKPLAQPGAPAVVGSKAVAGQSAITPVEGAPAEESVIATAGIRPSELIVTLLEPPTTDQLPGVALTLGEAVHDARTRQDQTARAKAYWELAAAQGEYYLAQSEATQLAALRQGVSAPGPAWAEKLRDFQARTELAKQSAEAAQLRLQQLLGSAGEGVMPLASDLPHCGRYNTEYEEIFAGRPDKTAQQLDELLPLRYEQLRGQAKSVAEAHDWLEQVSATRDPSTDGTGLIQAYDLLSLRRRAFLATARDYNQEIAAYIELAAPTRVAPDQLVAMMIRTSTGGQPPWERSAIQQTGGVESEAPAAKTPDRTAAGAGNDQATSGDSTRPTYRQVRRPFQRLFGREKSIVVERMLLRRGGDRNK